MPLPKDNLFHGLAEKMTAEQRYYVDSILDYHVVLCNAEAGSGKTTLGVAAMKMLLDQGKIDRVYYVFAPVEEKAMGYRPGTQEEKEFEYTAPLRDALLTIREFPEKALDPKHGWITAKSHIFMRGINMKRVGVIIDEAQNWTIPQLKKVITRVHDDSYLVIIGHDGQIDLPNKKDSGFVRAIEHFAPLEEQGLVRVCHLTQNFRGWISRHADKM